MEDAGVTVSPEEIDEEDEELTKEIIEEVNEQDMPEKTKILKLFIIKKERDHKVLSFVKTSQSSPQTNSTFSSTSVSLKIPSEQCILLFCKKPGPKLIVISTDVRTTTCIDNNILISTGNRCCPNHICHLSDEEHYDEIGTISYKHIVCEPTTNVTQENYNHMSIIAVDNDILRVESESSEESSLERLTGFSLSGDGYENPYQSINPENIEMHPYSSIVSNIYQDTIIFPTITGLENIKDSNIAEETSKNPWLIIYKKE
ncbi:unnamed protein product [Mytilus coruscus]|uniref:Uncharacterized protein n=1 Tax=Mytilus coruscus TaxID=42192 RepID=A0A6J7ZUM8_MYTCO|nr:unnamed protein product [Mytilus coruscus]